MAMMEAHGRHESFVTSAHNLKNDENKELRTFKHQNQRLLHKAKVTDQDFKGDSSRAAVLSTNIPISNQTSSLTAAMTA